jgi:RNA polymerase sigma-70 factor, ECF subfamily
MAIDQDPHEQLIIIKAQMGDQWAFEQLIRKYHGRILFYISKMLLRKDLTEDVAQEVWIIAWRKIGRLRATQAFAIWLYRIAHTETIRIIREESHYVELPNDFDVAETNLDTDEDFSDEEIRLANLALATLNNPLREAITLRFIEEMSYEDIAQVTSAPIGTVRSRLHYAKQALRLKIEEMKKGQEK